MPLTETQARQKAAAFIGRRSRLNRCTIYRREQSAQNATGGISESFLVKGTSAVISWPKENQNEGQAADQAQPMGAWRVVLPAGADVTETDRLKIEGVLFDVTGTNRGQSPRAVLECACVRVPIAD